MVFPLPSQNQIHIKITWIFLCFLIWNSNAHANALTLNDVLSSVDQHYPLVLSSQAELRKAEGDSFSAQGGFDPVIHAGYSDSFAGYYDNHLLDVSVEQPTSVWGTKVFTGWRSGQGNFPVYDAKSATFTGGEIRAGVEIPLLKGGATDERRTRILTTAQGVSIATEGLLVQKREIQKQAAHKYWDWVAAGRKVYVAKELLQIAVDRDQAIQMRIHHGDLAKIDQIDNERSIVQRRSGLVTAERYFQKTSFELSLYYRDLEGSPSVPMLENLVSESLDENVTRREFYPILLAVAEKEKQNEAEQQSKITRSHPEMKRIEFQIHQTETEFSLVKNQILPKLDIKFGVYSGFGSNPDIWYLPPTAYPTQLKASIQLEFPLFFRTGRGKMASTRALLDKMEAVQRLTSDKLQTQTKDSIQAMKAAHERLKLAREEIKLSLQLENSEKTRAFHGDSSFLLVNLREQTTRDAKGKEIDAYSEFYKAKAEYDYSLGG